MREYQPFYHVEKEWESRVNEFRVRRGLTFDELSLRTGIQTSELVALANGMSAPVYEKKGTIKRSAQAVADVLGVAVEDLFPAYFCTLAPEQEREGLTDEQILLLTYSERTDASTQMDDAEFWDVIRPLLEPKEFVILRLKFIEDMTVDQMSLVLDIGKGSCQNLLARTLRKLRHPSRRELVLDFYPHYKSISEP